VRDEVDLRIRISCSFHGKCIYFLVREDGAILDCGHCEMQIGG